MLEKASQNYKNLFDPETRLMRGRNADGTFQQPFSPYKWGDAYTEGNAWHYTWSVFHDVEGLIELMGGRKGFTQMLDSVFVVPPIYDDSYYGVRIHEITEMQVANMGNYAHGNQPAQHMIYLYDYCGQPAKAQWWAREVMEPALFAQARRILRRRGQRADIGMVCILGLGILSRMSRLGRIRSRIAAVQESDHPPRKRKDRGNRSPGELSGKQIRRQHDL